MLSLLTMVVDVSPLGKPGFVGFEWVLWVTILITAIPRMCSGWYLSRIWASCLCLVVSLKHKT